METEELERRIVRLETLVAALVSQTDQAEDVLASMKAMSDPKDAQELIAQLEHFIAFSKRAPG